MTSIDTFLKARDFLLEHRGDYEAVRSSFRWPQLDSFNWALDHFDRYAEGNTRTALWLVSEDGSETRLSFAELRDRSNRVANYLRSLGVRRGDPLLVMLPNVAPLWETLLAAMKLGAVIVPSTTLLSKADLVDRVRRAAIKHVVADTGRAEIFAGVEQLAVRVGVGAPANGWRSYSEVDGASTAFDPEGATAADDPLLFYFTSGTTSHPKLVVHSHQSYPVGHLSTMYWIGLDGDDVHFNISSPGWAKHAWSSFFAPWNAGATIFVHQSGRFSAPDTLRVVADKGVTSLCAPPTVWRLFVQEDLEAYQTSLRTLVSAGEPLNPELISRVEKAWGLSIRDGYGQTETTAQVGNPPGQPARPGSMGRPMPGYRVTLLDTEGNEADEGEIALDLDQRPLGLMQGYRDDDGRLQPVSEDRWYRTGDVARRDAEGYYWYVGRADDVFKSSDYRISPFELESRLIEHESVAEAAVVPAPDPLRLSVPKAYITLRKGFEPDEETAAALFRFCRERLAPYQRIRRIEFSELPKTISGKIRRVELRQHAASGEARESEFREEELAAGKE
ncbi:MAG: AMP-binding protein [Arenicellales bacterium]